MPATQVIAFPERLARGGIEARRPKTAEMNIDPARLNHRRWRGVTIDLVAKGFRVVAVKQLFVETNLSCLGIDTDGEEVPEARLSKLEGSSSSEEGGDDASAERRPSEGVDSSEEDADREPDATAQSTEDPPQPASVPESSTQQPEETAPQADATVE